MKEQAFRVLCGSGKGEPSRGLVESATPAAPRVPDLVLATDRLRIVANEGDAQVDELHAVISLLDERLTPLMRGGANEVAGAAPHFDKDGVDDLAWAPVARFVAGTSGQLEATWRSRRYAIARIHDLIGRLEL
jgi:hypothetical protein